MRLMLDRQQFNHKPTSYETGGIKNRLQDVDISLPQLAESIHKGCSVVAAQLSGLSDSSFVSQQLFMVDIDNDKLHISVADAIVKCNEAGIQPALVYESFSSTADHPKFRLGFLSETVVTDRQVRDDVVISLLSILSDGKETYCDTRCMDASRLFYGTDKDVFVQEVTFNVEDCIKMKLDINFGTPERKGYPNNKYNNTSYQGTLFDMVSDNLPVTRFATYSEAVYHLTHNIDMAAWLGVSGKTFRCIFPDHEDHHPSAGIFITTNGEHYYNCFGCGKKGNIITVTEKLTGNNRRDSVKLLMKIFNIKIEDSPQSESLKINQTLFHDSDQIEADHPNLHSVVSRYYNQLDALHNVALENCGYGLVDKEDNPSFFASKNYLASRFDKNPRKTTQIINLFAYLKLCNKLPDDMIDAEFAAKNMKLAQTKGRDNTTQFYSIPGYDESILEQADERARIYKSNNGTIDGLSREWMIRVKELGEAVADEIYPKQEGKQLSPRAIQMKETFEKIILLLIGHNQYVTEGQVLDNIPTGNRDNNKVKLKRCLQEILDDNGLIRKRATNEIKSQLGIEAKGNPIIIVKEGQQ
jgi:hypothetical protein